MISWRMITPALDRPALAALSLRTLRMACTPCAARTSHVTWDTGTKHPGGVQRAHETQGDGPPNAVLQALLDRRNFRVTGPGGVGFSNSSISG
jgi:hypothetical protein